jgi:hypothetical protein
MINGFGMYSKSFHNAILMVRNLEHSAPSDDFVAGLSTARQELVKSWGNLFIEASEMVKGAEGSASDSVILDVTNRIQGELSWVAAQ